MNDEAACFVLMQC